MYSLLVQPACSLEVVAAETAHDYAVGRAVGADVEQGLAAVESCILQTEYKIEQPSLGLPRVDSLQLYDASQMPHRLHASSCEKERTTDHLSIHSSSQTSEKLQGCSLSHGPCLPQARDLSATPGLARERFQNRGRGSQFHQLRESSIHMEVAGVGSNTLNTSSPTSPPVAKRCPRPPSRRTPPGRIRSPQSLAVVVPKATADNAVRQYLPSFAVSVDHEGHEGCLLSHKIESRAPTF